MTRVTYGTLCIYGEVESMMKNFKNKTPTWIYGIKTEILKSQAKENVY